MDKTIEFNQDALTCPKCKKGKIRPVGADISGGINMSARCDNSECGFMPPANLEGSED